MPKNGEEQHLFRTETKKYNNHDGYSDKIKFIKAIGKIVKNVIQEQLKSGDDSARVLDEYKKRAQLALKKVTEFVISFFIDFVLFGFLFHLSSRLFSLLCFSVIFLVSPHSFFCLFDVLSFSFFLSSFFLLSYLLLFLRIFFHIV